MKNELYEHLPLISKTIKKKRKKKDEQETRDTAVEVRTIS